MRPPPAPALRPPLEETATLDTNVLVRYLTQDDVAQARRANALIAETIRRREQCAVSAIVLCELAWVLGGAYGLDRRTVAATIEKILETRQFATEEPDIVRRALADYRRGPGDFSDHLVGWRNRQAGCPATATFDRALRGSDLFRVL